MARQETGNRTRNLEQTRTRVISPALFKVLMLNDDYTTMEFVVEVLQTIFHKPPTEANRIMLSVHQRGAGLCGIYPWEIAETKVARVHARARAAGFPLKCSIEQA